jgi:hypothetical protein
MFGNTLIVVHIMPLSVIYISFLVGYADSSVNYAIKSFITLTLMFENFFHFDLSNYRRDLCQNVR